MTDTATPAAPSMTCPHCGSADVHQSPRNARQWFCTGCACASISDRAGDVEGLRPIVDADLGRSIGQDEARAAFIWASKCLARKLTIRFGRAP